MEDYLWFLLILIFDEDDDWLWLLGLMKNDEDELLKLLKLLFVFVVDLDADW